MPYDRRWHHRSTTWMNPDLRVGDAERNRVVDVLSQHFTDGRLDATELKDRLDQAMGAKTRADLSGLLTDLPPLAPPPAPPPSRCRRAAMCAALVLFLLVVSVPWERMPWPWVPRIPWVAVGVVGFVLWRTSRRRRRVQVGP